ncbi:NAD(P)H-quinone oxidoreductase [Thalassotalea profundi]|uniref:NAD(P)H quinone oxidoreductase n=1 Tax=Thalassotalea profundi TaxID=2036687 RepID=A0ABQ3IWA0_9GAMM|nr:NAD(P)H-quinone oxidoreductase [Thalassotalea profundi]GHE91182.1 NAD(P)H quinone oxidoreductase [Thalassotalea profundi]
MQYITVTESKTLVFDKTSLPECDQDECLIEVKAIGINRADILQKQGKYPPPPGESSILGLEVSGIIAKISSEAALTSGFAVGDRVCALVAGGGYAQFAKVNVAHLIKLPIHFSFEQGASIAEVFLTAYQSLFSIGMLKSNESVLIHAGASGVGTAAIQLAKAINCHVVTTTSNEIKQKTCIALGADQVINYHEKDFVLWAKEHQPKGFNVILDVVGGEYLNKNINCLALDGRIIILSMLGGRYSEGVDIAKLLMKRATIHASTLRNRTLEYKSELIANFKQDFYPLLQSKQLEPVIDHVYSWSDVAQAHAKMEQNDNIGKLVLTVE